MELEITFKALPDYRMKRIIKEILVECERLMKSEEGEREFQEWKREKTRSAKDADRRSCQG